MQRHMLERVNSWQVLKLCIDLVVHALYMYIRVTPSNIIPDEKLLTILTRWWLSLCTLQSHCNHQPDHQCQFPRHRLAESALRPPIKTFCLMAANFNLQLCRVCDLNSYRSTYNVPSYVGLQVQVFGTCDATMQKKIVCTNLRLQRVHSVGNRSLDPRPFWPRYVERD